MVSTKDKLEFVFVMARHSNVSLHDCKRIMRYAATAQRLAETACNRELTPAETRKQERIKATLLQFCLERGTSVHVSGDPRGCVVKLAVPDGYTNDWGQEGICVPA